MPFEVFAAIVRDWSTKMTPEELHAAVERCLQRGLPIDDLAPGTTADSVLLRAAERGRPAVAEPLPRRDEVRIYPRLVFSNLG